MTYDMKQTFYVLSFIVGLMDNTKTRDIKYHTRHHEPTVPFLFERNAKLLLHILISFKQLV